MKYKTTRKALKEGHRHIIKIGYCNRQYLLKGCEPIAYLTRAEGWRADVYYMGNDIAICTGYAPVGDISPDWEMLDKYEKRRCAIWCNYSIDWQDRRQQVENLLKEFVKEALKNG